MQERVSSVFGRVNPSRKVSLLAAMVAAGTLFYSALAPALGLGEISLHSALNQPLNADIELVDAEGLDRADLAVGLATADEYSRAGIDRVFFLNDLRFTPVFKGSRKFIHVSSVKPVLEPYLSFLVQVSRPGGQLLRDYTVLLDPAGTVALTPAIIPTGSAAQADQGTDYTRAAAMSSAPPPAPAKPAARPAAKPPAAPVADSAPGRTAATQANPQTPEQLTAAALQNQHVQQSLDQSVARAPATATQVDQASTSPGASPVSPSAGTGGPAPAVTAATPVAPVAAATGAQSAPAPAPTTAPAAAAPPASPAPLAAAPVPAQVSPVVQDSSDDDSWLLIAAGLAALILLLALLLLARRRRQQQAKFEPVMAISPVDEGVVVRPARTPVLPVTEAEIDQSTRRPDPTRSNKVEPVLATAAPAAPAARRESGPATDALDGASIYIAYGRFNEALGILREGLNNEPTRTDLRVRMLEVLGQQGDAPGFAEQEAILLADGYSAAALEQLRARYPKLAPAPVAVAPAPAVADSVVAAAAAAGVIAAGVAAADALRREPAPPAEAREQLDILAPAPLDLDFDLDHELDAITDPGSVAEPLPTERVDLQADDFPDLGSFDDIPDLQPAAEPLPESFDEFQLNLDDLSMDADWGMVSPFDTPGRPKAVVPEVPVEPEEVDFEFASNLKELPEVFEMQDEHFLSDFADPQLPVDLEPGIEIEGSADARQSEQDALDNAFLDSFIADADLPELDALTVDFDDLELQQVSAQRLEEAQAFIGRGDLSQASDLLLELLRGTDDSCKHAARQLLASIN